MLSPWWQQEAQAFNQKLNGLRGNHEINARWPLGVASITKQHDGFFGIVELDPFTQGSYVMPRDLGSDHQRFAPAGNPAQAHLYDVFGNENPIPARLEHSGAKIAMLTVEQNNFWRGHHCGLTLPSASLNRMVHGEREKALDEAQV